MNGKIWNFAFASAIGNSHISGNIPCQDCCSVEVFDNYTISVVCDGAGSCDNSHLGSAFVVKEAILQFNGLVRVNNWHRKEQLPDNIEWQKEAKKTLYIIKESLDNYSLAQELSVKSMSCTIIVVISFTTGLLSTHIGDGRAGYCNSEDQWFPLMIPFHGSEANETVFITSDIWYEDIIDKYIECTVINEDIKAFCLLSDGCEKAAFECNLFKPNEGIYYDPNLPYGPFFKANIEAIPKLFAQQMSQEEVNEKWKEFLSKGNEKLKVESDDKTLILGVRDYTAN